MEQDIWIEKEQIKCSKFEKIWKAEDYEIVKIKSKKLNQAYYEF